MISITEAKTGDLEWTPNEEHGRVVASRPDVMGSSEKIFPAEKCTIQL